MKCCEQEKKIYPVFTMTEKAHLKSIFRDKSFEKNFATRNFETKTSRSRDKKFGTKLRDKKIGRLGRNIATQKFGTKLRDKIF